MTDVHEQRSELLRAVKWNHTAAIGALLEGIDYYGKESILQLAAQEYLPPESVARLAKYLALFAMKYTADDEVKKELEVLSVLLQL